VSLATRPLLGAPTKSDHLTDCDRAHLPTYLFLLDWSAGGGDWRKATEQLFSEEIATNHSRAKKVYEAHLARAKWMTQTGYRLLLDDIA
jgi:hypothetical protein